MGLGARLDIRMILVRLEEDTACLLLELKSISLEDEILRNMCKDIACFDVETNEWSAPGSDAEKPRSNFSSAMADASS